ncbi:MAG: hypothetical protein K5883_04425 [Pseudobutyrivibrio sp.]|nr:hypothetical protein [Pseudobutyrivibrio sp.]
MNVLNQFDPNTELVIDVDGSFVSPIVKRDIVYYKHKYSGIAFTDEAIVLSEK